MSILSAFYLPGQKSELGFHTPVNNFRFIFNRYFNGGYPILEEKSYFSDYKNMYEFFDVTSDLK